MNLRNSFMKTEAMKRRSGGIKQTASALPYDPLLPFEEVNQKKRSTFSTILSAGGGSERFGG